MDNLEYPATCVFCETGHLIVFIVKKEKVILRCDSCGAQHHAPRMPRT